MFSSIKWENPSNTSNPQNTQQNSEISSEKPERCCKTATIGLKIKTKRKCENHVKKEKKKPKKPQTLHSFNTRTYKNACKEGFRMTLIIVVSKEKGLFITSLILHLIICAYWGSCLKQWVNSPIISQD